MPGIGRLLGRFPSLAAAPGVQALAVGGLDLCADLGCSFGWEPLLHARSAVVMAAASAGICAVDMPWFDLQDDSGLEAECQRVRALGYGAKLAETLKGIGQSIVKAVEVPEVTSDKPFPVADSMGLSDQTNAERPDTDGLMVDPIMAESTAPAVVESPKEDTAAGCFPYRYW